MLAQIPILTPAFNRGTAKGRFGRMKEVEGLLVSSTKFGGGGPSPMTQAKPIRDAFCLVLRSSSEVLVAGSSPATGRSIWTSPQALPEVG